MNKKIALTLFTHISNSIGHLSIFYNRKNQNYCYFSQYFFFRTKCTKGKKCTFKPRHGNEDATYDEAEALAYHEADISKHHEAKAFSKK